MKKINSALSNEVFDMGDHIQKHKIENYFKSIFGGHEIEIIESFNSQLNILHEDDGWFAINKLPGKELFVYSDKQIISIAKELRRFHNVKIEYPEFINFEKAYKFLGGIDDISEIISILQREPVLLHNDLVKGNILIDGNNIHLIDFEYSGYGNQIFDVASFIIERKLSKDQEKIWISQFYDTDVSELKKVKKFLSNFWKLWAEYMYESTSLIVYKEIKNWHEKNIIDNDLKLKRN